MEQLKVSVLSVCMLSAAVGICSLLRPGKALERQIRLLISVLFVISLATPLMRMEIPQELDILAEERMQMREEALSAEMEQQILTETRYRTEQALIAQLAEAGITCTKIEASLYIDSDGCIYCSDINAECDDFAGACAVLESVMGKGVNISVTEILF